MGYPAIATVKQFAPTPPETAPNSPALDAIDATVLMFQTDRYSVRIFREAGDLRMNLYNQQTSTPEQQALPMQVNITDAGITFTNRGDRSTLYSVWVAPDGNRHRLTIRQGDRVTYDQPEQNQQARQGQSQPEQSQPEQSQQPPRPSPAAESAASPSVLPSPSPDRLPPIVPQSPAPQEQAIPDSATIARFQTAKYAVRVYDDNGELRMNLYNRGTAKLLLDAAPVEMRRTEQATTYVHPAGQLIYAVTVLPVGGYRLAVSRGDRVIYDEAGY